MSRSSVLKSNWVIVDPADTRVIDTNALAELKLRQMAVKLAEQCGEEPDEFVEGFTQGINAVQVSELMRGEANVIGGGQEAMEEPLDMDYNSAQFQPDQPETLPHEELIAEAQAQIEAMKEEAIAEISRDIKKGLTAWQVSANRYMRRQMSRLQQLKASTSRNSVNWNRNLLIL